MASESQKSDIQWKDYWTDAMIKHYAHYSDPQRRWAWAFLAMQHYRGNESILDIGSADGRTAADLSKLIHKGEVTGIDLSPKMVHWAKKQYHHLDYPNLQFIVGDVSSLDPQQTFDLILSFYTLPFSSNPTKALIEMKQHLKSNGKILLTVPADGNPAFKEAMVQTKQLEKWKKYWGHSPSRTRLSAEDYKKFLNDAGLKVIRFEKAETVDSFVDREEFAGWIKVILPPVFKEEHLKDEFCSDVIDNYVALRKDAKSADGVFYGHFSHFEIEAISQ